MPNSIDKFLQYKKTILPDEIKKLNLVSFGGTVYLVEDKEGLKEILPKLKLATILGFDTETRPSFRKGRTNKVALLQLSTADEAFLIRLNKMGLPKEIVQILTDPNTQKIGVAIRDDIKALRALTPFVPNGFVELQEMVKDYDIQNFSLKKLVAIILGFRISKNKQLSNWEATKLSEPQICYAATDAWTPYEIFMKLTSS